MPAIKSPYTIKQFEEKLREYAYKLAVEAVNEIPKLSAPDKGGCYGYSNYIPVIIKSRGCMLEEVDTPTARISFEGKQINVTINKHSKDDKNPETHFALEEKIYNISSDNTKISLWRTREDKQGIEKDTKTVNAFLSRLMDGIKPEYRYSLVRKVKTGHAIEIPA